MIRFDLSGWWTIMDYGLIMDYCNTYKGKKGNEQVTNFWKSFFVLKSSS